jgi:cell division protein FtsQ
MNKQDYPVEVLAEEEPRYLRRQKPVDIKRHKFGKRAWKGYFRVFFLGLLALALIVVLGAVGRFLYASPRMSLLHPSQISIVGNHYVPAAAILEIFGADRNRSVLRIPLDERRRQIEALGWIEQATVRRILPNRLGVEISERVPVAFLRQGTETSLVDASGVILEKPLEGAFHFPVVTGLTGEMPRAARQRRMLLFSEFITQIDAAQPGASDAVSEVDLTSASDLHVTFERLPGESASSTAGASSAAAVPVAGDVGTPAAGSKPVVVHFGDHDFGGKLRVLLDNIGRMRAAAGRVDYVDLRFGREAVVMSSDLPAAPGQQESFDGPQAADANP